MKQIRLLGRNVMLGFLLGVAFSPAVFALEKAKTIRAAEVRREPDGSSELLGRYPMGSAIKVVFPDQDGWYAILFSKPLKGATRGWVKKDDIELLSAPSQATQEKKDPRQRQVRRKERRFSSDTFPSDTLAFNLDFYMLNPSEFFTAISQPAGSKMTLGFGLEYGKHFTRTIYISAAFGLASASAPSSIPSVNAYAIKSYLLNLTGEYAVAHSAGFDIRVGVGIGLALSSVENSNNVNIVSTSGIMTPFFLGKVAMDKVLLGEGFGARLEAGYRMLSLSNVPVLAIGATTQSAANVNLGGLFFGGGLFYAF